MLISASNDVFRLLAEPLRAQLVQILADGPACVCHLVDDTGAKQPNISNHLRALREAGLIVGEPRGRLTYYRLVPEAFDTATDALTELAARARRNATIMRDC